MSMTSLLTRIKSFNKKPVSLDYQLLQQGFYRTLALQSKEEAYRLIGYLCCGTDVTIEQDVFKTFPLQLQNRFLARALPFDLAKYQSFLIPAKHNKRLSSFAGLNPWEPFGVFGDDTYYLYRSHKAFMQHDLAKGIHWLTKHFTFHFPKHAQIDDYFYPPSQIKEERPHLNGPLISVILCAKNEEKQLARALISLMNQTFNNIELVFIDDGSEDNTAAIYEQYCEYFPATQYIKTTGLGLWQAKNLGLKHAKGDYVTFHDADDWSHNKKLEFHVKPLLKRSQLKATTSLNVRISEHNDGICTKNALFLQRLNPSSLLFSRQLIAEVGCFFDDLLASDIEFIKRIQLFFGNDAIKFMNLPLMIGTERIKGLSNLHHGIDGKRMKDWEMWNSLHQLHSDVLKNNRPSGMRFRDYLHEHGLEKIKI